MNATETKNATLNAVFAMVAILTLTTVLGAQLATSLLPPML